MPVLPAMAPSGSDASGLSAAMPAELPGRTQRMKGPLPAYGSCTTTATRLVHGGGVLHVSGGEMFAPSHVYSLGIISFAENADDVTVRLALSAFLGPATATDDIAAPNNSDVLKIFMRQ